MGKRAACLFLASVVAGEHEVAFLSQGILRRAAEIDSSFEDLDLGFVDAAVMAYVERHDFAVLTFDFAHFRATPPKEGHWRLVVDESRYTDVTG